MNRVLHIPELLGFIFGYLDASSQFYCTFVCKRWSEIALDEMWKRLDQLNPLLCLLSPLAQPAGLDDFPLSEFERPIKADDWIVFKRYARRVRTLNCVPSDLSSSVFSELAQKRPSLTLLPNLTRLEIGPRKPEDLVHALLFMSQNVEELHLRYPCENIKHGISNDDISEFFKECAARMPKLKVVELSTQPGSISQWIKIAEKHLQKFLSSLVDLKTFKCSLYFATSPIITALSRLPFLRVIAFDYASELGFGRPDDLVRFIPLISPGAFSALVDLSFCAAFKDSANFLGMDFAPNLMSLSIHSPHWEYADELHQLLGLLSQNRQRLSELCLSCVAYPTFEPLYSPEGHEIDWVDVETLLPLLGFSRLSFFQLAYPRQLQLNNADLERLLSKWQCLECLHLCSDPSFQETPMLTPDVLPIIAKCCPKLRELSLYLSTHVAELSLPSANPVDPIRFTSLQRIEFGTSPLAEEDVSRFALYLSALLPPTCRTDLLCGTGWLASNDIHFEGFEMDEAVVERWHKASWALGMLIKSREQERARTQDLQREAKDLAMRVAMLEEQRRLGLSAVATTGNRTCAHQ